MKIDENVGLDGIPVATERSRRDLSIGEVKFDIWDGYPGQKPLQSAGFIQLPTGKSLKNKDPPGIGTQ